MILIAVRFLIKEKKIMLVCAIIIMSWFILLALIQMITESNKFKPSLWVFLHSIVIISMSILGIIGVACK